MQLSMTELETSSAVKQANRLIESVYRMEANEQKIILLATKIVYELEKKGKSVTPETEIVIAAADFAREYGTTRQLAFEVIREAKNTIYERSFDYTYVSPEGVTKEMNSRWIHMKGEVKAKSEISMFFAPAVIPFIYLVEKEFTLLDLKEIGRLKSKYAIRLYKILMKWRNAKYAPKFSYEDLRKLLGLEDQEYTVMSDFRKRVLKAAVDQINKGTGFVGLQAIDEKKGGKIVSFTFKYSHYDNDTINITPIAEKKPPKPKTKESGADVPKDKEVANTGENSTPLEVSDPVVKKDKPKRYFDHGMTEGQAYMFANKIALNLSEQNEKFMYLSSRAEVGETHHEFINKIAEDFLTGNLEPYADALSLLGYVHHT